MDQLFDDVCQGHASNVSDYMQVNFNFDTEYHRCDKIQRYLVKKLVKESIDHAQYDVLGILTPYTVEKGDDCIPHWLLIYSMDDAKAFATILKQMKQMFSDDQVKRMLTPRWKRYSLVARMPNSL